MRLLAFFTEKGIEKPESLQWPVPERARLEDVGPGEFINVEWPRQGRQSMKVINNDPVTKKILLHVPYEKKPKADEVFDYSDKMFKNFNLLNPTGKYDKKELNRRIKCLIEKLEI